MNYNITDLFERKEKNTPPGEGLYITDPTDLEIPALMPNFIDECWGEKATGRIKTGYPLLDFYLEGGLRPDVYTLGAISSLGKTTFALNLAVNIARSGEAPVLFYSFEMLENEIIAKIASSFTLEICESQSHPARFAQTATAIMKSEPPDTTTRQGAITYEALWERLNNPSYWKCPLYIRQGTTTTTIDEMRGFVNGIKASYESRIEKCKNSLERLELEKIEQRFQMPVLIIDYLQVMASCLYSDVGLTDKQKNDRVITALSDLKKDLQIPIILVSSLNRASYTGIVQESSFKETGLIEYHSDVLLGLQPTSALEAYEKDEEISANKLIALNRKEKKKPVRDISLTIIKQRLGRLDGHINFKFDARYNNFQEVYGGNRRLSKEEQLILNDLQKRGEKHE